jgi:hypothetical protein
MLKELIDVKIDYLVCLNDFSFLVINNDHVHYCYFMLIKEKIHITITSITTIKQRE